MFLDSPKFLWFQLLVKSACLLFSITDGVDLAKDDFYGAVVVEYSPAIDPAVDGKTNLMNNVRQYVNIVQNASDQYAADMVIFSEIGLWGYDNQRYTMLIPDPESRVVACTDKRYDEALKELSCVARKNRIYILVNLDEIAYDNNRMANVTYNTNVVFDFNGEIVARYRKMNLFDEDYNAPGPKEEQLVYFDTNFGVRFGVFTCFDIIFKEPAVALARSLNITHFASPSAWVSDLPFGTATQQQWYWSYTLDVVLLASGYNYPNRGSTGSGIYIGRKGPAAYRMTEDRGSFMIYSKVPKNFRAHGFSTDELAVKTNNIPVWKPDSDNEDGSKLSCTRDLLDVYETSLITVPEASPIESRSAVSFSIVRTLCNGSVCCDFDIKATASFSSNPPPAARGDDYSTLYYRLAAFDGVRRYGGDPPQGTGGLQVCAIFPCVSPHMAHCGLRADDASAEMARLGDLYQSELVFDSITITAKLSANTTFTGPNVLLKGEGQDFGSLPRGDDVEFHEGEKVKELRTTRRVEGLVAFAIYGRAFDRDGQPYTGQEGQSGCPSDYQLSSVLTLAIVIMAKTFIE